MAVFNTEVFQVKDVAGFKAAIEKMRPSLEAGGASDIRVFRQVGNAAKVIITAWWPTAEACRTYARDHEAEFMSILMPQVTEAEAEYVWEQV